MTYKKLVFITSHPIQYQVPIFKRVSKINNNFSVMYDNKIEKNVIVKDQGFNKDIEWGRNFLKGYKFSNFRKKKNIIQNIKSLYLYLKINNIDYVILSGWNNTFYKFAFLISKILKIKIILRCENNFYKDNIFKKNLKKIFLRFFFSSIYKFISIGKKNKEMYLECGVPKKKIINANYFVDSHFFSKKNLNKKKKKLLRKKFKKKNQKVYLFVGKFIKRKGLEVLFNAIKVFNQNNENLKNKFLIIGSGPDENKLKQLKKNYSLNNIFFLNFKNQKQLLYFYDLADFLILPSYYETWGLVANESLEMGTPCIVSNGCGCANDLIKQNINGFSFENGDYNQLANLIHNVSNNNFKKKFTYRSIKHSLKNFNLNKTVDTILKFN